jgi:hypothetical protein
MEIVSRDELVKNRIITDIDITTNTDGGYITVPESVLAGRKMLVRDIMPGEYRYVMKATTPIDKDSGRIVIDTNDGVPPEGVTKLAELDYRPAAMRVLYGLGQQSVTGFVIDFRRVREPVFDNIGLADGVFSPVFAERQELHATELPIGVLFNDLDRVHYVGAPGGRSAALWLAQQVDKLAIDLQQKA